MDAADLGPVRGQWCLQSRVSGTELAYAADTVRNRRCWRGEADATGIQDGTEAHSGSQVGQRRSGLRVAIDPW